MDFAAIEKDVVFLGVGNIIEVWNKNKYESNESMLPRDEFEQLANEIFGENFNLYD